jgi:transcriptional regulator with XRE-family HTH domain
VDTDTGLTFGDLLRRFRGSADLTQEDLAERTGLTTQAISLLERGRNSPSLRTIFRLAEVLGVKPSELLDRVEKAKRS